MLGPVILAASRSDRLRRLVSAAPVTRPVVDRFIPGENVDDIVPVVRELTDKGLELTMDVVGEDITTPEQAAAARDAYLELIDRLKPMELGRRAEMSVKLSMFGQALPGGHELALANVRPVVEAADAIGTTVTLDAEDHTTLDSMFAVHEELRRDFPGRAASSRRTSSAPRPTPAVSPRAAAGCGWSRARTRSRPRSRTRTGTRSTRRTSACCGR